MKRQALAIVVAGLAILSALYLLFLSNDLISFAAEFAVALLSIAGTILWWGFRYNIEKWVKKTPTVDANNRQRDRKFEHIEGCLFYPPDYKNLKINPKKRQPVYRLLLLTDLRLAFYMSEQNWDLVLKGIINSRIEFLKKVQYDFYKGGDEAAFVLAEWMVWNSYRFIERVANESDLFAPCANSVIANKKPQYRRGENVLFWTYYRGNLSNGFFSNQIFYPNYSTLTNGKNRVSVWPYDTLESGDPNIPGKLDGYVKHESQWNWNIPLDAPLGEYRVYMRIHNHFRADNRPVVSEIEDTFVVVEG